MALCNASQAPAAWIMHNYTGGGYRLVPTEQSWSSTRCVDSLLARHSMREPRPVPGTSTPLFALDNSPYGPTQTGTDGVGTRTPDGFGGRPATKNWQMESAGVYLVYFVGEDWCFTFETHQFHGNSATSKWPRKNGSRGESSPPLHLPRFTESGGSKNG